MINWIQPNLWIFIGTICISLASNSKVFYRKNGLFSHMHDVSKQLKYILPTVDKQESGRPVLKV